MADRQLPGRRDYKTVGNLLKMWSPNCRFPVSDYLQNFTNLVLALGKGPLLVAKGYGILS